MDDELFIFVAIGSEYVATSMIERIEEQQFCELRAETRGNARRPLWSPCDTNEWQKP